MDDTFSRHILDYFLRADRFAPPSLINENSFLIHYLLEQLIHDIAYMPIERRKMYSLKINIISDNVSGYKK